MNPLSRQTLGHRGKRLEVTIIASQCGFVRLDQIPSGCKRLPGGRTIDVHSPVDFIGEVCATGRAIHLDAKECADPKRFPVGNKAVLKPHQREWLIRHGEANAIAGLLIEATHPDRERFFWMDWRALLRTHEPSVEWSDPRLQDIGDTKHAISFGQIIAMSPFPMEVP